MLEKEDEYQNICLDLWELDFGENIWQIKYFNVPTQMTRHITVMVKTVSFKIGLSSCIQHEKCIEIDGKTVFNLF